MSSTYYSIVTYATTEPETGPHYTVPFPFIRRQDVRFFINSVLVPATEYEWVGDGQIRYNGFMPSGSVVVIRRFTRRDTKWAEYNDGSTLTDHDLNIVTNQLLYITQELYDYLLAGNEGGTAPPGGIGSGGNDAIEDIVRSIIGDQLLANLTELIRLIDINAETTMATVIGNHRDWAIDREVDFRLTTTGTRIDTVSRELVTEREVRAEETSILAARLGEAEGSILETREAVSTTESAVTNFLVEVAALFGVNDAGIVTLQQAIANAEQAFASVQQQIEARVPSADLDDYLNESQVIQGVRTRLTGTEGEIEQINSSLVDVNGNIAAVQTTVAAQSSQLGTEAQMRLALASRFGGQAETPSSVAASLDQFVRTYADETSTTAQSVRTLQANTQPIFFRATPPNWTNSEFNGSAWSTNGFPAGSLWYREIANGFYVPYRWIVVSSPPFNYTAYTHYGPYGTKPGLWMPVGDHQALDARGSLIQFTEETYVREDEVGARVQTQLQTVYGPDYATINERLETWVNPGTGVMYSGWDIRINQTGANGVPVIAGIGLGMQTDLANPNRQNVSSFIVMADTFRVIRPPTVDPITGTVDLGSVVTPFEIDTTTNTVGINGRLLVTGSLNAYDGVMGRLTIGALNAGGNLANPNGMRLVLPSSRNNWNASNGASPFQGGSDPQRFLLWAGSGTMNHANHVFYVDTDGNASFSGQVYAQNIAGDFNDAVAVQSNFGTVSTAGNGGFVYLPNSFILGNSTGRSRKPFAVIGILMFGGGQQAGRGRIEMQEEVGGVGSNVWGAAQNVAESPIGLATGSTLTLSGGLPYATSARIRLLVSISRQEVSPGNFSFPQSNQYSGILVGLR